jgi:hypothetical protein
VSYVGPRQRRVRVLETLERRARQFRSRKEIWPLRVPREPLRLDDVIDEALPDGHAGFEAISLRSRTLLNLRWADGAAWEAWIIALPSGLKLFCDSDGEETRILASGRRDAEGVDTDKFFLELLSESAGEHFGIETSASTSSSTSSRLPAPKRCCAATSASRRACRTPVRTARTFAPTCNGGSTT